MKRIILLSISILSLYNSYSQDHGFGDNKIALIGGIGQSKTTFNSETDNTDFTFQQSVGFFINKHVLTGFGFEFGSSDTKSLVLMGRYYKNTQTRFSLFGSAEIKYSVTNLDDSRMREYGISFSPGFNYFITDALAFETKLGSLGYTYSYDKDNKDDKSNNLSFGVNLKNINIGIICTF